MTTVSKMEIAGNVKQNEDGNDVPFVVTLDFSKCSVEEVQALAADGIIVRLQGRARSGFKGKSNMAKDGKTPVANFQSFVKTHLSGTVDVKAAIVDAARAKGKPASVKIADMFAGMSKEEKAATLKLIASMK